MTRSDEPRDLGDPPALPPQPRRQPRREGGPRDISDPNAFAQRFSEHLPAAVGRLSAEAEHDLTDADRSGDRSADKEVDLANRVSVPDARRASIKAEQLKEAKAELQRAEAELERARAAEREEAKVGSELSNVDRTPHATSSTTSPASGSTRTSPIAGVRRVNVNFSEQAYRTLDQLSQQTGKSMSDVLRDAIALKVWFEQTRAEGGHVLVERPDGKIREVISV